MTMYNPRRNVATADSQLVSCREENARLEEELAKIHAAARQNYEIAASIDKELGVAQVRIAELESQLEQLKAEKVETEKPAKKAKDEKVSVEVQSG